MLVSVVLNAFHRGMWKGTSTFHVGCEEEHTGVYCMSLIVPQLLRELLYFRYLEL